MTELVMRCPNPHCEHGRLVEVGVGEYISDTDMGPCPGCEGAGVVPDVVGQLQAKVAELTEERDRWKSLVQKELPEAPGMMDTLHTGYYAGAQQGDMDGFLWMMATDARIQGTYAAFYQRHPEHQRGYWNYENAAAAAGMLVDFVNQYSALVESAVELAAAHFEFGRLIAREREARWIIENARHKPDQEIHSITNRGLKRAFNRRRGAWLAGFRP